MGMCVCVCACAAGCAGLTGLQCLAVSEKEGRMREKDRKTKQSGRVWIELCRRCEILFR